MPTSGASLLSAHSDTVCDRLWLKDGLSRISGIRNEAKHVLAVGVIVPQCGRPHRVRIVRDVLVRGNVSQFSMMNGFCMMSPPKRHHLPRVNLAEKRLLSPRIPFMYICRLTKLGQYGVKGKCVNVPVGVQKMCNDLPRNLTNHVDVYVNIT
ncbi:hypothetical protein MRX96_022806 [Rhipicephalus microplus]